MTDPKQQTTDAIVESLLSNKSKQYTESAHAEIFRRLMQTIEQFNRKTERTEKFMLVLATSQVLLALAQLYLGFMQVR